MISKIFTFLTFTFVFSIHVVLAQQPSKPTTAEIYTQVQKLNFVGSVLYVAAHPDDENTRLISFLANDIKARTGYLSLTRGDGGQNLRYQTATRRHCSSGEGLALTPGICKSQRLAVRMRRQWMLQS